MIKLQQSAQQRQALSISQSTITACNVLSMGVDDLYAFLQDSANENPLISFESIPQISPFGRAVEFHAMREKSIDFITDLDSGKNVFGYSSPLTEHLTLQIPRHLDERRETLVRYLICCLDSSGYFRESLSEYTQLTGSSEEEIESALAIIQKMDPPGIGARDLRECLLLQLEQSLHADPVAYLMIRDHFQSIGKNQFKAIARAIGCTVERVYTAMEQIRSLESRPAHPYVVDRVEYVTPDITIGSQRDGFPITLNHDLSFTLRMDESCEELLAASNDKDAQLWLRDKQKQFSMLQLFIKKRNQTLLLVCSEIFQAQKPFFFKGREFLRPLKQKEIADALSCHESTVFRAVNDKYLTCEWGTFPLTYFFSNRVKCCESYDACNPKELIRTLIDGEDKHVPLSDGAIAELLVERGVQISRRTVAKYRDEIEIPVAAVRKIYA